MANENQQAGPAAKPSVKPQELVVIIRNPRTKTLHALLNKNAGPGALAVFESNEQAMAQTSTIPDLAGKEFFIVPIE